MVSINIEKRHLYLISAVFIFLVGVGLVISYNTNPANPSIMGHSFGELENVQYKITNGLTACAGANKAIKTIDPITGVITCETDDYGSSGAGWIVVGDSHDCNYACNNAGKISAFDSNNMMCKTGSWYGDRVSFSVSNYHCYYGNSDRGSLDGCYCIP